MANKSIRIAIYKYVYEITAHDILQTINKIGSVYAWCHLSQFTILLFLAKHTGNIRI